MLIQEEETLQMRKDNDVWLSIQPLLDDEDRLMFPAAGIDHSPGYLRAAAKLLAGKRSQKMMTSKLRTDGRTYKNTLHQVTGS